MKKTIHGYIELPEVVDITDPCYDEDVWCRMNNVPIEPGTYECYTRSLSSKETDGWGSRIAVCGIRKEKADSYKRVGMIGVDAGLAGFFNCDNVVIFDDIVHQEANDVYIGDNYFFTSSGYGDGGYDVYAGYKKGQIVELYIRFI